MQKSFDFISDPGHGWIKVPFDLLQALGITTNISRHSYMRGEYAYLEEDRDASLFHQAFEKHYGKPPQYRMRVAGQKSSRVRNYDTYNAFNKYFL